MDIAKPEWLLQMEGILEALNEGVLIADDCNQIIFANACMTELSGRPASELVGRTSACFYSGKDLEFINEQIARGEQEGRNRYEFFVPRADGSRVPVVVSARVIEDPEGRRFAIVTFTDISEQKHAEERLRRANEQLEERHKEIETELALASRVQQSLAPKALRWGRVAVETYFMPVRTIGGDFGLVAPLGDGVLNLLVCDVSGHGISSALLANRIYTETVSLLERGTELGEMLRRLNHFVVQQIRVPGFYFTMAAARLAENCRRMSFAGGGHPPGIWIPSNGEPRLLESQSMILGALDEAIAENPAEEVELKAGDRLAFYTDGLTEVFDLHGEMLGVPGLQEIMSRHARKPLGEMKQAILDDIVAWRSGPHTDDMSLVLLEVN